MAAAPSSVTRNRLYTGHSMQPTVKTSPPVQTVSAFSSADNSDRSPVSVGSQVEPSSVLAKNGRRDMISSAFAVATLGASNKAAFAKKLDPESKEGTVDAPPWVLPLAGLATVVTAAVPVLLKPGEEALEQQRENERIVKERRDGARRKR